MKTYRRSRAWPLLAAALTASGCGRGTGPDTAQIDTLPGGAVRVRNGEHAAWTPQTAWRASEEWRLGRTDGQAADLFTLPAALEVDAYGRLYVLDAGSAEVRVFGPDGRHVRSMGGQGAGPGEFRQPMGMTMGPDGSLWVMDPGNARFTVFDTAGALRTTVRRDNNTATYPWPGRIDRRGRLWDIAAGSGEVGSPPALLRMDPASGRAERFPLPSFAPQQFVTKRGAVTNAARVPFSPELVWTLDAEGRVWSGVSDQYRLRLHQPAGDTVRVVERTAAPVAVTAAERDSVPSQMKWFTDQGGRVDLSRLPSHKPAFVSVTTDDRGWLWVRPSLPAGARNSVLDVFSPDGLYQGRVTLPVLLPERILPLVVHGDRIDAVVLAEDDVPQVVRFRIEGRGPADARMAAGG